MRQGKAIQGSNKSKNKLQENHSNFFHILLPHVLGKMFKAFQNNILTFCVLREVF